MLNLQHQNTTKRNSFAQHNAFLTFVNVDKKPPPLPYLAGVGQIPEVLSPNDEDILRAIKLETFLCELSTLLGELDQHIGSEYLSKFLDLSSDTMLDNRHHLFNDIIERLTDLEEVTRLNGALFENILEHTSLFSLKIKQDDYSDNKYHLAVTCDEAFFVYNVDQNAFPEFIHSFLNQYIDYLGNIIGAETVTNSFLQYQLECELERYECAPDYKQHEIDGFKKFLLGEPLTQDEKTTISSIEIDVINHCGDASPLEEILETAVILHDIKNNTDEAILPLENLSVQFELLVRSFPDSIGDVGNLAHFALSLIKQQLEILKVTQATNTLDNDLIDNGDVPMVFNVMFSTEDRLYNSRFDLNDIGEQRTSLDEYAQYTIDTSSTTAVNSLHNFIIAEYFAYQLCNVENMFVKGKGE